MTDTQLREKLLSNSSAYLKQDSINMAKLSLENESLGPTLALWLKISTAVIIGIGAYVWTTVQASKDQNAANDKQIAVMQEQLSALAKTVDQHAALFVEIRGMIKSVEDQVRGSHAEALKLINSSVSSLDTLKVKFTQVLDDLHWLKAEKLTESKYQEYLDNEEKAKRTADTKTSSTP